MKMKIMFMGTPDFALEILKSLHESAHEVTAVVTRPDKPKGRGYSVQPSPVKIYAESKNLPVYQPKSLRGDEFYNLIREISPDVIVVAAYGNFLPLNVLEFPKYGCINVHASILPKYRGAAPIQRAIMNGETVTGVTIMQMNEGIDTGDMLSFAEIDILPDDNFQDVHEKLAVAGSVALLKTIEKIGCGEINPIKQNDEEMTYAPKIEKFEYVIDFTLSAVDVHNKIRALSPFPLAYSKLNGKILKFVSSKINMNVSGMSGTVLAIENGVITVACGIGAIDILTLIPEGKKKMSASDYINGRKISVGDIFGEV